MTDDVDSQAYFPWDSLIMNGKLKNDGLPGSSKHTNPKAGSCVWIRSKPFFAAKRGSIKTSLGFFTGPTSSAVMIEITQTKTEGDSQISV
jgi:hypothetical protein